MQSYVHMDVHIYTYVYISCLCSFITYIGGGDIYFLKINKKLKKENHESYPYPQKTITYLDRNIYILFSFLVRKFCHMTTFGRIS